MEAVTLVIRIACAHDRVVRALDRHEGRYAAGDHQRDRDHLTLERGEIAEQLAIERSHQVSSSGRSLRELTSVLFTRPSARVTTRSAMLAMGALCVMIAVVVPSSRLTCSSTCSTT